MHVLRDTGCCMQRDRCPDLIDILLCDGMASQEVTGGIRAIDFESLLGAAVLMRQAHVVEHRTCIKQFRVESESATLPCQSAPVVDAARMVKEQCRFGVPHQLHYFASELAVRNADSRKISSHRKIDTHARLLLVQPPAFARLRGIPLIGTSSVAAEAARRGTAAVPPCRADQDHQRRETDRGIRYEGIATEIHWTPTVLGRRRFAVRRRN